LLDWSGFLINSHDPLRVHVLKHIRQNSLTSLRYSVAEQGRVMQKPKSLRCKKPSKLGFFNSSLLENLEAGYNTNGYC
jgi:hypothetical protein